MSPICSEDINDVLKDIIKLLRITFNFDDDLNELEHTFIDDPIIKKIQGKSFLKKKNFAVLFDSFEKVKSELPSLLNGIFQILLSHPTEPILLMGPSGFKTFLSQLFLKSAKIITLNQESTVQQLLGSSAFLSKDESKIFYIKYICKVCHLYNQMPTFINQYNKCKSNMDKFKEDFRDTVNPIISTLPKSFRYSIEQHKQLS